MAWPDVPRTMMIVRRSTVTWTRRVGVLMCGTFILNGSDPDDDGSDSSRPGDAGCWLVCVRRSRTGFPKIDAERSWVLNVLSGTIVISLA